MQYNDNDIRHAHGSGLHLQWVLYAAVLRTRFCDSALQQSCMLITVTTVSRAFQGQPRSRTFSVVVVETEPRQLNYYFVVLLPCAIQRQWHTACKRQWIASTLSSVCCSTKNETLWQCPSAELSTYHCDHCITSIARSTSLQDLLSGGFRDGTSPPS